MKILGTPIIEYVPALVLLALTLVYLATGYGYTPESRAFPVTVGWAALALAIVDIVSRTQTAIGYAILQRLNPAALPEKAEIGRAHV